MHTREYAQQVLDAGVLPGLAGGEHPLRPADRDAWQRVRDAAQAEVDWAFAGLPRTRIKGRRTVLGA